MPHSLLIKFGKFEHMKALYETGEVYLGTLDSYQHAEGNAERHDPDEGLASVQQMQGARLRFQDHETNEWRDLGEITSGLPRFRNSHLSKLNVFCLFYCEVEDDKRLRLEEVIDLRLTNGFGDAAVLIYQPKEFLGCVKAVAQRLGHKYQAKMVSYVPITNHEGDVGPFLKDERFQHQREFRIVVADTTFPGTCMKLKVGPLKELALLLEVTDIRKLVFDWV